MRTTIAAMLFVIAAGTVGILSASAQVVMRSQVVGSGASAMTNGTNAIVGTVGQAVIGPTLGTLIAGQGFWYTIPRGASGVREERGAETGSLSLSQNYPNPFSASSTMRVTLPQSGNVSLKLYDEVGRQVMSMIDGYREAGTIVVTVTPEELSSGRYSAVLMSNGQRRAVVITVLK